MSGPGEHVVVHPEIARELLKRELEVIQAKRLEEATAHKHGGSVFGGNRKARRLAASLARK
jgi:hypothetical protein